MKPGLLIRPSGQRKGLRPGEISFINALGQNKQKVVPISFHYQASQEPKSGWRLMTSSRMTLYQSRREICIFSYNKEIENVDFRGIGFPAPLPKLAQRDR